MSTETTFENLGLADSLLRAVRAEGYETATPIQQKAIGPVLAGHDLMGCAQTGTGKTAAFALPTLQRLSVGTSTLAVEKDSQDHNDHHNNHRSNGRRDSQRRPAKSHRPIRSLILAPTRELAAQIGASFATYGKFTGLRYAVVYGGVGQGPQVRALQQGVDILVATPGRLEDLMEQGYIDLRHVEILILDEADQMLDMGFIVPLRRIVAAVPRERQTLMFSATMPPEIRKLTTEWLRNPTYVEVAPVATPAELVEHSVHFVEPRDKLSKLQHFLENTAYTRTLVFSRTKHGADKIVKQLSKSGIRAAALHSNKSQSVRQRTLEQFKGESPARAGGDRHRGPRPRRRRDLARGEFRPAGSAGSVRPPHRPHRPRRRDGHRHELRRPGRARPVATDRTADEAQAHRQRRRAAMDQ